jgi:hypothetical protein
MPRILQTLLILLFVFGAGEFTTSPAFSAERINVEYHHSEISFSGDDSFVTGRYTWKPLPDNRLWKEMITFAGGSMVYYELQPGRFYTGANQGKQVFVRIFNKNTYFQKRGHSVSEADVIELSNAIGNYYLVSSSNDTHFCGMARQFAGESGLGDGLLPNATKVATVYFCRNKSWGSKFKINKFIQDIMDRARYDEGKLNKMRAAARK